MRTYSGSTLRSPSIVPTQIGKKQKSAMTASFGPMPKPSTSTKTGASTTVGTLWLAMRIGYKARRATVETTARTGVEMEALTAAGVAALIVYDMVKGIDPAIVIEAVRLLEKTKGEGG